MSDYIPYTNYSSDSAGEVDSLIIDDVEPDSVLIADNQKQVRSLQLTANQLVGGQADGPPIATNITGTPNQVIVESKAGEIKLSLPQDIHKSAFPEFFKLRAVAGNGENIYGVWIGGNLRTSGCGEIVLNAQTKAAATEIMFGHGNGVSANKVWWSMGGRGSSDEHMFRIYKAPAHTYQPYVPATETTPEIKEKAGTWDFYLEFLKDYVIRPGQDAIMDLGQPTRRFRNFYSSGLVNGRNISLDGDKLDSIVGMLGNFVTLNLQQTIVGIKTFTAPIVTTSTVDGRDVSADGARLDIINANYVTTNTNQTISGTKTFSVQSLQAQLLTVATSLQMAQYLTLSLPPPANT